MLFEEVIAVYIENRTQHTDLLCERNAEFSNVRAGAAYRNHCSLKG
jgi:hypothetical protein